MGLSRWLWSNHKPVNHPTEPDKHLQFIVPFLRCSGRECLLDQRVEQLNAERYAIVTWVGPASQAAVVNAYPVH